MCAFLDMAPHHKTNLGSNSISICKMTQYQVSCLLFQLIGHLDDNSQATTLVSNHEID